MAKVFISHRTADMALATRLASELQAAGHTVWLDDWEIGIGDSILGKMGEGLRDAEYLVLCYSAHGVNSPWTAEEWESFRTRQLNGKKVKLLPVNLSGGPPPIILEHLKYADLVHNWADGLTQLLKAIR
ncbi:toll/interleukin-1 receptor domain-containing protein [Stigmatella hybrida]|uniref:toll/interleukin-1 receptor domain-containing protein n=1 Tax=Stigmatella hybrida TaxID=394097 RepID=UPI001CDA8764|nr:toll/interleukin-1 receptor domain-containing protein [Stigmatella hybrida]